MNKSNTSGQLKFKRSSNVNVNNQLNSSNNALKKSQNAADGDAEQQNDDFKAASNETL